MRITTVLSTLLLLTATLGHVPAFAEGESRASLRLVVVDQTNAVVPSATVTIYTLDGNPGITVTADDKGVAVFPSLPTGMAQIHARRQGLKPYIEKTTLHGGENAETVTLYSRYESE